MSTKVCRGPLGFCDGYNGMMKTTKAVMVSSESAKDLQSVVIATGIGWSWNIVI